jgi:hypothetical protein
MLENTIKKKEKITINKNQTQKIMNICQKIMNICDNRLDIIKIKNNKKINKKT